MNGPTRIALVSHARRGIDRITGTAQLLYPEGVLELSETADAVVTRLDGTRTINVLIDELAAEYEADREIIRPDVDALLADLDDRGLLKVSGETQ